MVAAISNIYTSTPRVLGWPLRLSDSYFQLATYSRMAMRAMDKKYRAPTIPPRRSYGERRGGGEGREEREGEERGDQGE